MGSGGPIISPLSTWGVSEVGPQVDAPEPPTAAAFASTAGGGNAPAAAGGGQVGAAIAARAAAIMAMTQVHGGRRQHNRHLR